MRSVAVARELGILAGDVESARLVLGRVGSRLEQQYNEPLAGAIECLATIHAELVAQCQQLSHNAGSWGLDPNWLPIALAVASRRQPVLITIAVNAIRSLTHHYENVLENSIPAETRILLRAHLDQMNEKEERLLDARRRASGGS